MPNRPAAALALREGDRERLVLLAADGVSNTAISELVGLCRSKVIAWRRRYEPWRDYGVQPWRAEKFKFSTDPELIAEVTDVVGLYLAPPENAIALSVDEKSQIQALDRTAPILPMQPGLGRLTHDYFRHGTSTLCAALEVATGKVTAACKPRRRHQEFLAFLKQVSRAYPDDGTGRELHLIMDNYAAHKTPGVKAWLKATPRIVHFTPTHASWMNLVEVWFSIIERQAIPRHLPIRQRPEREDPRVHRRMERPLPPLRLDQTADEVLNKANRHPTSGTAH